MARLWRKLRRMLSEEPVDRFDPDNPGASLDMAYQRQLEALAQVRRVSAELSSARQRLDHQVRRLTAEADRLTLAAERALAAGDEVAARDALAAKNDLSVDLTELDAQRRAIAAEQEEVHRAGEALRTAAESLRAQRERVLATDSTQAARRRVRAALDELRQEVGAIEGRLAQAAGTAADVDAELAALAEWAAPERGTEARPDAGGDDGESGPIEFEQPPPPGGIAGEGGLR